MTIVVNATFVNGHFQPAEPLSLPEGTEVRLAVTPVTPPGHAPVNDMEDPLEPVIGICSSRSNEAINDRPAEEPPNEDDPLEAVLGICKGGPRTSLAADHDLYLYGRLRIE